MSDSALPRVVSAALARARRSPLQAIGLLAVVLVAGSIPAAAVLLLERALSATLEGDPSSAWPWAAGFAACVSLNGALHVARTFLLQRLSFDIAADLRRALHRRLLGQIGPGETGARLAALTTEIDEVQFALQGLVGLLRDPWSVLALLATAAWLAPGLLGWAAALVPPVVLVSVVGGRWAARTSRTWIQARARLSSLAQEQLVGAPLIRAFQVQHGEGERFGRAVELDARTRVWRDTAAVLPGAATQAAIGVAVAILLGLGALQVEAEVLEGGALAGFAVALALLARPAGRLSEIHSQLRRAGAALEGVARWLDGAGPTSPPAELPEGALSVRVRGGVVDYGERRVTLPDLEVKPGQAAALVGPTGSGKTSLLRALLAEVPLLSGEVQIGGLAGGGALSGGRIAVVHQRPLLFDRSLRENLTLGRPIPDSELHRALRAASATFVLDLPEGLDTLVGELGDRLSGGEGQRLALARALCGQPGLLLLDEPTSHVDVATRDAIIEALRRLSGRVTVVCATHDEEVASALGGLVPLDSGV